MGDELEPFPDWMDRLDKIMLNLMGEYHADLVTHDWFDLYMQGYTPMEAFEQWHFDMYGAAWDEDNGQFGVGA